MTTLTLDRAAVDSLLSPSVPTGGAVAVSYLRVSTKEQAEKGGTDEGYSIPAQREANRRKAEQLGATVIEEFVDAGESARTADRPELMRMIQYVTEHQVNYCVVHKVDRLARNRADDVTIHLALRDAGVMLAPGERDLDILANTLTPDRHLGYAVQWFGLAITVLVVALVLTLRKTK